MKKILLSLFVGLIGLINFGYCEFTCIPFFAYEKISYNTTAQEIINFRGGDSMCIINDSTNVGLSFNFDNGNDRISLQYREGKCYTQEELEGYTTVYLFSSERVIDAGFVYYPKDCLPKFTSLQCQTEYNLIPISSVDQNYCVSNGLCPSSECPDNPGDNPGDLQYSNIYINNILHPGRQNIFVNIPDYITWDYSQNEVDFNVYVGSGYDEDYINSIVDINSYRPTSEDFTNVFVSGLTLVFPYIFIALLILFMWKLIKRIFK